jgi:ATP synthase F1 delta subunit
LFHKDRWAAAFIATAGEDITAAYDCLKAMVSPVKSMQGYGQLAGKSAAIKLEEFLRKNTGKPSPEVENTIRFLCLLVEKGGFKFIDMLLERIEQIVDEKTGILDVTIESALPLKSGVEEMLTQMIKETTGAKNIKIKTRLVMEMLGGYRLRIGGFFIDASLKGQLDQMKADLTDAAKTFAATAAVTAWRVKDTPDDMSVILGANAPGILGDSNGKL